MPSGTEIHAVTIPAEEREELMYRFYESRNGRVLPFFSSKSWAFKGADAELAVALSSSFMHDSVNESPELGPLELDIVTGVDGVGDEQTGRLLVYSQHGYFQDEEGVTTLDGIVSELVEKTNQQLLEYDIQLP